MKQKPTNKQQKTIDLFKKDVLSKKTTVIKTQEKLSINLLLSFFKRKKIVVGDNETIKELFSDHNIGSPSVCCFTKQNYKQKNLVPGIINYEKTVQDISKHRVSFFWKEVSLCFVEDFLFDKNLFHSPAENKKYVFS